MKTPIYILVYLHTPTQSKCDRSELVSISILLFSAHPQLTSVQLVCLFLLVSLSVCVYIQCPHLTLPRLSASLQATVVSMVTGRVDVKEKGEDRGI